MPDVFVPPITGAPLRTRQFFNGLADQARRGSLAQISTGPAREFRSPFRWVKITAASRDGSNFRWTYTAKLVMRTATTFGAWTEITGNLTAFNSLEQMNGSSGVMGNGVNTADLADTGLELQAAPIGAIIRASFEFDAWIFEYANAISGSCDP